MQVFETRTQWSRYALTQPEVTDPAQGGKYNTTEIHCTEFFPAVRWGKPAALLVSQSCLTDYALVCWQSIAAFSSSCISLQQSGLSECELLVQIIVGSSRLCRKENQYLA